MASVWVWPSTILSLGLQLLVKYLNLCTFFCSGLTLYIGTPALTSRGFLEADFVKVAEFFDETVKLALKIKAGSEGSQKHYIHLP